MLPTCLLLLLLIFLALSSHMVLDAIPAWGQAPSSGRRSFWSLSGAFWAARTHKQNRMCRAGVRRSRIRTEDPLNSLDVFDRLEHRAWQTDGRRVARRPTAEWCYLRTVN